MRARIAARVRIALVPRSLRRRGQPGEAGIILPRRATGASSSARNTSQSRAGPRPPRSSSLVGEGALRRVDQSAEHRERRRRRTDRDPHLVHAFGIAAVERRPRWRTSAAGSCAGWPECPVDRRVRLERRRLGFVPGGRAGGERVAARRLGTCLEPQRGERIQLQRERRSAFGEPDQLELDLGDRQFRAVRLDPAEIERSLDQARTAGVIRRLEALHVRRTRVANTGLRSSGSTIQRRSAALGHQRGSARPYGADSATPRGKPPIPRPSVDFRVPPPVLAYDAKPQAARAQALVPCRNRHCRGAWSRRGRSPDRGSAHRRTRASSCPARRTTCSISTSGRACDLRLRLVLQLHRFRPGSARPLSRSTPNADDRYLRVSTTDRSGGEIRIRRHARASRSEQTALHRKRRDALGIVVLWAVDPRVHLQGLQFSGRVRLEQRAAPLGRVEPARS